MMRSVVLAGVCFATMSGCASGPSLIERQHEPSAATFDVQALIVASDLDMAATGYADQKLRQLAGQRDTLTVLSSLSAEVPRRGSAIVSQSVVGWPGPLALSNSGQFVYAVETQGEIDDEIEEVDDPYIGSPGESVTTIDISDPSQPQVVSTLAICGDPAAIDPGPEDRFLIAGCRDQQNPLVVVGVEDGIPTAPASLNLAIPEGLVDPEREGIMFSRLAPDGKTIALNIGGTVLGFASLELDENEMPIAASWIGEPMVFDDSWLSMGRWSTDGRHYVVADVGWGPGSLDAVTNGAGSLIAIAFDPGGAHQEVSRVTTSLSPEGFDFDRTGTMIAVANMERTYLPDGLPYSLFGRRDQASLSLVRFNPGDGSLSVLDGPVAFEAVLPEDVVFDDDGDMIAVVSYQEKSETPQAGWVEFFAIADTPDGLRIQPTGRRIALPRGAHDLLVKRAAPE